MCTVTLVPLKEKCTFVLTSNRDEAPQRETLPPQLYLEDGVRLVYPKDMEAGGTWLGISQRKRLLCLLNGGFSKHEREVPYRMSRGVVVKELLLAIDFEAAVLKTDLQGVEPFTLVTVEWQSDLRFFELVWDGRRRHFKRLPIRSHIWSSSPLYEPEVREKRKLMFKERFEKKMPGPSSLLEFHESAGIEDPWNALVMDREFVRTRSISQIGLQQGKIEFFYRDLQTHQESLMLLSDDVRPISG